LVFSSNEAFPGKLFVLVSTFAMLSEAPLFALLADFSVTILSVAVLSFTLSSVTVSFSKLDFSIAVSFAVSFAGEVFFSFHMKNIRKTGWGDYLHPS
jgi:hypothetical protein